MQPSVLVLGINSVSVRMFLFGLRNWGGPLLPAVDRWLERSGALFYFAAAAAAAAAA
jgi:hypothetical protein